MSRQVKESQGKENEDHDKTTISSPGLNETFQDQPAHALSAQYVERDLQCGEAFDEREPAEPELALSSQNACDNSSPANGDAEENGHYFPPAHDFEQNHPQYHNRDGRDTSSDEDTDEYVTASEGDGPHEQNHPQYHNGDGRNTSSDEDTDEYVTASDGNGPREHDYHQQGSDSGYGPSINSDGAEDNENGDAESDDGDAESDDDDGATESYDGHEERNNSDAKSEDSDAESDDGATESYDGDAESDDSDSQSDKSYGRHLQVETDYYMFIDTTGVIESIDKCLKGIPAEL